MRAEPEFSPSERKAIRSSVTAIERDDWTAADPSIVSIIEVDFGHHAEERCDALVAEQIFDALVAEDEPVLPIELRESVPLFRRIEPQWTLGLTDEFKKSIRGIDRKLKGRVLDALFDIIQTPTKATGDTVKPLSGDFKSLWRYRIGDHRLVYKPDPDHRLVFLVAFTSRADAYR